MKLYTSDEHLATLAAACLPGDASVPVERRVELAWYLRQRDTPRALAILTEAERSLASAAAAGERTAEHALGLRGRIALIRAEAAWLAAHLGEARAGLDAATASFAAAKDWVGLGDASLLEYLLAYDRGDVEERRSALRGMAAFYDSAGERERVVFALAWTALDESFFGSTEALLKAGRAAAALPGSPVIDALLDFSRAQQAFLAGDYARSRVQFEGAAHTFRSHGLIRQSISALVNAGAAAGNLNDFETQVEIVNEALILARAGGWPQSLGVCLYGLGDAHHSLGRFAHARTVFAEARERLQPLAASRPYVAVTTFLAEVDLKLGLDDEALEAFEDARAAAERGGHNVIVVRVLIGLAACLSRLGRAEEAWNIAHEALRASEGRDLVTERLAMLSLARIHGAHAIPPPEGMTARSASLHYLERIWSIQSRNPDWTPDDEILGEFAAAWERLGETAKALQYERRRIEALTREGTRRAEQHVAATQARHEALAARLENEHQHRILESERRRQLVLEQLGMIGQEITGSLSAVEVLSAVDRHVGAMLDAAELALWLIEEGALVPAFARRGSVSAHKPRIALHDRRSVAARAAREAREILIEGEASTALFAPLVVRERMLGVISVRSAAPHAYGASERLIFKNICAYTAIALANASNYEMLRASHERLVAAQAELERVANIDALTGLCNRRQLMLRAEAEIARSKRSGTALCVVMLDIDKFKRVNDTLGHAAGDTALRTIAELLLENLRPSDTVARYGGEEVVALLPETEDQEAMAIAERIRQAVAAHAISHEGNIFTVTASLGVARWHPAEATIEAALARADRGLYQVKHGGRNGVAYVAPFDELRMTIASTNSG